MRLPTTRLTPTFALLAVSLLLVVPVASAVTPWGTASFEATPFHDGDRLAYRDEVMRDGRDSFGGVGAYDFGPSGRGELRVDVALGGIRNDRFGQPTETASFRYDLHDGANRIAAVDCALSLEGGHHVRSDVLDADPVNWRTEARWGAGAVEVRSVAFAIEHALRVLFDEPTCPAWIAAPAGGEWESGTRLGLDLFLPGIAGGMPTSGEGQAGSFDGRDAITFPFDVRDVFPRSRASGTLAFTVVEGVPGVAAARFDFAGDDWRITATRTLFAYEKGSGAALPMAPLGSPTARHPDATFLPWNPVGLDDAGLELPFRFDAAYEAARTDPNSEFGQWLAAHPDAWLQLALYDRDGRDLVLAAARAEGVPEPTQSDGAWWMTWHSSRGTMDVIVTRSNGADSPLGPLGLPAPVTSVHDVATTGRSTPRPASPVGVMDLGSAYATAKAEGVVDLHTFFQMVVEDADGIARPVYALGEMSNPVWNGDGPTSGRLAILEARDGGHLGVLEVAMSTTTTGLLAGPSRGSGIAAPGGAGVLSSLGGVGIAGTIVLAGLAAVLVLAKLLHAPLYTRLARHVILQNVVRRRIHDLVTLEPGIAQASVLVAGGGSGAARRHVKVLVDHGFLVEVRDGGKVGYYVAGAVPHNEARHAVILRSDGARRVHALYSDAPETSLRDAARTLGMSAPTVHRHKKKLEAMGLLGGAGEVVIRNDAQ